MLGKLFKQELRATGRIMLPVFAALLVLSVLANGSIRLLDSGVSANTFLRIILILLIVVFSLGLFGVFLITLWLMITRFYRNLLKDEGYLMHTLPVSVHGLVWAKLLTSLVWFVATAALVFLIVSLSTLIQNGSNIREILAELPSLTQIRLVLLTQGIKLADLTSILFEGIGLFAIGFFASCLHFYAAMAMGHMFNKDKILLSIVFFVLLSFAMSFFTSFSGVHFFRDIDMIADTMTGKLAVSMVQRGLLYAILLEGVQAAVLYFATTLSLRRGLNLG